MRFYLTHFKVFILSSLNTFRGLYLKLYAIYSRSIGNDMDAISADIEKYVLTTKTCLFDRLTCRRGNALFINALIERGFKDAESWNEIRDLMYTSKEIFDRYYSVLKSPYGYLDILDDLYLSARYINQKGQRDIEKLYHSTHPIYSEVAGYMEHYHSGEDIHVRDYVMVRRLVRIGNLTSISMESFSES